MVGIARALSDGEYQSVIYDLSILPEYQSKRLGSLMMEAILERLTTPNAVLWSVPGKESFYAGMGFKPMLTAMAKFEDPEASASRGYIKLG
ncbi:MAG: GNAT family N-acetyltransferase [Pseudodesulfovibrio sp.]